MTDPTTTQTHAEDAVTGSLPVNGSVLDYAQRGEGVPVLFLHGAVTDRRMWEPHLAIAAAHYKALAYTQRYHGGASWSDTWPPYGVPTHADDLVGLVRQLQLGPVHLVAWSYAGQIAFDVALRHPELLRSVHVHEPGVPSFVEDTLALAQFGEAAGAAFGPVFGAIQQGDEAAALKLMLDVSGGRPGYFDSQPRLLQEIELDNARTMGLLLLRQAAPPAISAAQLRSVRVPMRVTYGQLSHPIYRIVGAAAAACTEGGRSEIAGRTHMWPIEHPDEFMHDVMEFIAQH